MKICEIPPENRPIERLERNGSNALSDAELLAVILRKGTKDENAIDMSNRLISKYGINKLSSCSITELQEIKGIGKVKASQIIALFELNKRHNTGKNKITQVKSPKDVFDYISPKLIGLDKEYFIVLHLNSRNLIIKDEIVSIGTLNSSLIHPREVFKSAIKESANAIIIVHNHPSGDPNPSNEDIEITDNLMETGRLLNIEVIDHVIIGNNKYYSFNESNN